MTDPVTAPELSESRPTLLEWLRGRVTDFRRAEAARNALCEHDERTAPCAVCSVRYW
jgi:hypothetical protein